MFHISVKLDQLDGDRLGRCSGFSSLPGGRKTHKHQIHSNLLDVTNDINQIKSGIFSEFSLKTLSRRQNTSKNRTSVKMVFVFSAPEELQSIIQEVKYRTGLQSAKLIRQLRRRDRLCHKLQKNCDIITACLQAVSQKRRKNSCFALIAEAAS